ncbi:zinc ribbon domain-containing protein [Planococcus glaciei]
MDDIVVSFRNCGYSEFHNKESADAFKVVDYFFDE